MSLAVASRRRRHWRREFSRFSVLIRSSSKGVRYDRESITVRHRTSPQLSEAEVESSKNLRSQKKQTCGSTSCGPAQSTERITGNVQAIVHVQVQCPYFLRRQERHLLLPHTVFFKGTKRQHVRERMMLVYVYTPRVSNGIPPCLSPFTTKRPSFYKWTLSCKLSEDQYWFRFTRMVFKGMALKSLHM